MLEQRNNVQVGMYIETYEIFGCRVHHIILRRPQIAQADKIEGRISPVQTYGT